ncbi:hypothetical protein [Patulibacter defluvii]|uniref:hypothetical protein n=1 Tax=Patulibacter defluvii TaxID=3095358 RepID=UPI002A76178D|nr:hypothetical protein [Patulibacter sp. DM4]
MLRSLLVPLLAAGALLTTPIAAGASAPSEGWIYYVCGDGLDLCRIDPDGSGQTRLTTDGHAIGNPYGDPAVSADGRRLFYRSKIGPLRGYVRDLTTDAPARLVIPSVGYDMAISPDGSRVAFQPDYETACTASAVDGGARRCVATTVWGLAFANATHLIGTFRPYDPSRTPLSPPNGELVEWPADGSAPPRTTIRMAGFGLEQPAVSPDGRLIAVAVTGRFDVGRIAIFDRASGRLLRYLTENPSTDAGAASDGEPSWSPDGRRIVFQRELSGQVVRLFVTAADGAPGSERPLTAGIEPVWGPRPGAAPAPEPSAPSATRLRATASKLSVRVSTAASVRFTVDRRTVRGSGKRRRVAWVRVTRRTVAADRAGAVALRLGTRLKPGRYRLAVTVRETAGSRSRTVRTSFRIR